MHPFLEIILHFKKAKARTVGFTHTHLLFEKTSRKLLLNPIIMGFKRQKVKMTKIQGVVVGIRLSIFIAKIQFLYGL